MSSTITANETASPGALLPDIPEHIKPLFLNSGNVTLPNALVAKPTVTKKLKWVMDMIHENPGEPYFRTQFSDPSLLSQYGYNVKVVGQGRPPHAAITWETFDTSIFPTGSLGRAWVEQTASAIKEEISSIHASGLKALYWFDICVLPIPLVEKYKSELFGSLSNSRILSMESLFVKKLHRIAIDEVFATFSQLDGLVVRTGEVYTCNTPHHRGFSVISQGPESHVQLLSLLREEVAVKRNRHLFYRTWSFDKLHSDSGYYLQVVNRIEPHPNLAFIIKHTQVDFWRGVPFNPTLKVGNHPQLVEVQCQREYEGKGAFPNYIANGVIEGFEELLPSNFSPETADKTNYPIGLQDIIQDPRIIGIFTWSRGGGWCGPYISNELWVELNVSVISQWALNPRLSEKEIFHRFAKSKGLSDIDAIKFRELAIFSARAVLKGQYISRYPIIAKTWMRDQYLGGADHDLAADFRTIRDLNLKEEVLLEKAEGQMLWERIRRLSREITFPNPDLQRFFLHSVEYGRLLYKSIYHSWAVTLEGFCGKPTGTYSIGYMAEHLQLYDQAWSDYRSLESKIPDAPTMFLDKSFNWLPDDIGMYHAHSVFGMGHSVDMWRKEIEEYRLRNGDKLQTT